MMPCLYQYSNNNSDYFYFNINIIFILNHMSKTVQKQEKATLEEEKSSKIGFENAPKLFSKWSYDDIKVASQFNLD